MSSEDKYVKRLMKYVLSQLDGDEGQVCEGNKRIYADDILFDLEFFAKELYEANIEREGDFLNLEFENGQKFSIGVEEKFDYS